MTTVQAAPTPKDIRETHSSSGRATYQVGIFTTEEEEKPQEILLEKPG